MAQGMLKRKYTVPRNPGIPSPNLDQILGSGPVARAKDGGAMWFRVDAYRCRTEMPQTLPRSALIGTFFCLTCTAGFVLIPGAERPDISLLETIRFLGIHQGLDLVFPGLNLLVRAAIATIIEDKLGEGHQPDDPWQKMATRLMAGQAIWIPFVDVVDVEYRELRTFWAGKRAHLSLTYMPPQGQPQVVTLTAAGEVWVETTLGYRTRAKQQVVMQQVLLDLVGAKTIAQTFIDKYIAQYGGEDRAHVNQLIADVGAEVHARAQAVPPQEVAAGVLRRLAPMEPHYRGIPGFETTTLQALARGDPELLRRIDEGRAVRETPRPVPQSQDTQR